MSFAPSLTDTFAQGGQTQLHKFHMIRQVLGTTLKISFGFFLAVFIALVWIHHTQQELWLLVCYGKAYVRTYHLSFLPYGFFDTSFLLMPDGSWREASDAWLASQQDLAAFHMAASLLKKLFQSLGLALVGFIAVSGFWLYTGSMRQKTKVLSGLEVVSEKELHALIQKKKGGSPYKIGTVAIPKDSEFQHTLITGTTGSGKSNMIVHLLTQIRQNGDQAIVVDTTGVLKSRFYDAHTDHLLNPLDPFSKQWDLWSELEGRPTLVEEMAASLIPETPSYDIFWVSASRTILCECLRYCMTYNQKTYKNLGDMLLNLPLKDLHDQLKGTPAAGLVDPGMDKTALSIRATMISYLHCLASLKDSQKKGFSCMQFGSQASNKEWLFLSCQPDEREYLKPLFSTWVALLIKGIMRRPVLNTLPQRTWIILDELASLNKLPSLLTGLSEIRKYGGCFVLGFQDPSQIEALYGHHQTKTLSNLTGTKAIFRITDTDIAARMARLAGEAERQEATESISYGAHQMRDGVNLSTIKHTKPVLTATDVMMLQDLECFIKFPGDFPVAKVRFEYMS